MSKRPKKHSDNLPELSELLPGMEWLADHDDFDDGDTYFISSGRVAEYVGSRGGLVVRLVGKEVGFVPILPKRRSS